MTALILPETYARRTFEPQKSGTEIDIMEKENDNIISPENNPGKASALPEDGVGAALSSEDIHENSEDVSFASDVENSAGPVEEVVNSYGSFRNRWSYAEYEKAKSATKARKNYRGLRAFAFCMTAVSVISVTLLCIVLAGGIGNAAGGGKSGPVISIPTVTREKSDNLSKSDIIKKAKPGVVGIVSKTLTGGKVTAQSIGSGFIITDTGYIVTNNHVVKNGDSVSVLLMDGSSHDAKIIGGDSLSDIAVLKIDVPGLSPVELGNSEILEEGDPVIAIGTPAGIEFAGTCTHGMVSAIDRNVKIKDDTGKVTKTMTVIQIDASINPGNSGGPVINGQGQVVGIATLKIGNGYEGMGFALPINGVVPIVNELIANGKVVNRPEDSFVSGKAEIGVTVESVSEEDSKEFDIPLGAYVRFVKADSAAEKAGIKMGDIITKFDSKKISTNTDLSSAVEDKKPGDVVTVVVFREGEYITFSVTLGTAG